MLQQKKPNPKVIIRMLESEPEEVTKVETPGPGVQAALRAFARSGMAIEE